MHFPRIQGADIGGEIVAVGLDVNPTRIGERVLIEPCLQEHVGKPWASALQPFSSPRHMVLM
ncbi:alcohol dehydrogenase catalytic domain-containing protein [Cobetia marina]|uniref:alcohol dehydrogenase catalytic domain-containing protein n=1 Tax=Cobetia marina TaxID=28258 RepID=UPI00349E7C20